MIGKSASLRKTILSEDILAFSDLSTDKNPVHLDEAYAAKTPFKRRIAHGMYVASLISAVIANELPGPGAIYLEQNLRFVKPVFVGDEIEARVTVLEEIKPTIYRLATTCLNQDNSVVIEGTAVIKFGSKC